METTQRKSVIYTLYAFDGKGPRYCGHTVNPAKRFKAHKIDKNKTHKSCWIKSVGPENIHMSILEITTPEKAPDREIFYIKKLRAMGFDLTNHTDGGEGSLNPSPETRAKLSLSHIGKTQSPETRAKRSESLRGNTNAKGQIRTPEFCAKISKSLIGHRRSVGHHPTAETRAKLSVINTGRTRSPETKARMSAARTGVPLSSAHCEKLSLSHIGKTQSPETRAKMSLAQRARYQRERECSIKRTRSPETCAKLSAARRNISPETRAKMSAAKRNISPETRARMSLAQKARYQRAREQSERGA
jgi:group I intron endonuclease